MRLIDADLLLAVVETGRRNLPIPDNEGVLRKYLDWDGVKYLIERAPTIDAVPVEHARWALYEGFWACSECGCSPADWEPKPNNPYGLPPYCHCCGAKMEVRDATD